MLAKQQENEKSILQLFETKMFENKKVKIKLKIIYVFILDFLTSVFCLTL